MDIMMTKKSALESKWVGIVTIFLYITVVWNVVEGAVSVYFGYNTGDMSLFAFGIDSWIEVLSASLVLYNMIYKALPKIKRISLRDTTPLKNQQNKSKSSIFSLETERKLTLFIGWLLILFCLFACVGGIFRLIERIPPSSTIFGIIIGGICVVAMAVLWYYKTKASVILNSSTLASDAACSLGCIKLSTVLLIGSILYQIWPQLWWVDAVTAILIGLLVGYEGYQTVKGAMDKDKFEGGCGCCGAADTGLAKYLRNKIEKELGIVSTDKGGDDDTDGCCNKDNDDCCGDKANKKDDCCENKKDNCCDKSKKNDDCCGDKNNKKPIVVKSYGSVNNKVDSCCSGGTCSGK